MAKILFGFIMALILLGVGAFIFYKMYLPTYIAEVITEPETPTYLPSFMQENIKRYKAPINKGAENLVAELHDRDIPVSEVVEALDQTSEQDIQAALNELKASNLKSSDQAFNIIKSHVKGDIDLEPLRDPFKDHVNIQMIQEVLKDENFKQYQDLLDPGTIKDVAKEILIQKEAEFNASQNAER